MLLDHTSSSQALDNQCMATMHGPVTKREAVGVFQPNVRMDRLDSEDNAIFHDFWSWLSVNHN